MAPSICTPVAKHYTRSFTPKGSEELEEQGWYHPLLPTLSLFRKSTDRWPRTPILTSVELPGNTPVSNLHSLLGPCVMNPTMVPFPPLTLIPHLPRTVPKPSLLFLLHGTSQVCLQQGKQETIELPSTASEQEDAKGTECLCTGTVAPILTPQPLDLTSPTIVLPPRLPPLPPSRRVERAGTFISKVSNSTKTRPPASTLARTQADAHTHNN